jgi:hypothetical protein
LRGGRARRWGGGKTMNDGMIRQDHAGVMGESD